jgi:antitoxin VapB
MSVTTKLFTSNRTQAVRLPKAVAFPVGVEQVSIERVGDAVVIRPAAKPGLAAFLALPPLADFPDRPEIAFDSRD